MTSGAGESGEGTGGRRRRRLRIVGACLLVSPLVAWLGITLAVKLTVADTVPFPTLMKLVAGGIVGSATCWLGGCEAELIDGMTVSTFDDRLAQGTLVALDVDERGRVLLAESHRRDAGVEDNRRRDWLDADLAARRLEDRIAYQRDAIARGAFEDPDHFTRESDRLVVLADRDGDGRADLRSELAAWNEEVSGLIAGVESREGTTWVANIPSVYAVRDENADGVAESTTELVRGFGVKTSLGGHDLHGLAWGPDGRIYFSVGDRGYHLARPDGRILEPPLGPGRGAVFRMQPDGSELEVFATGLRNPQELAFDEAGNLFTGDNNGDGGDPARLVYVVEGGDSGWAMPYQSLSGDYVRGPWMAERLFDLQHATQPAWILPPIGQIGNGPSGLVHYPGLGLPDRYAGHFFLCDYAYLYGQSGIWSFAVEPEGAGFELVDLHRFIWSVLTPDFDFSWDGRMFAARFDQFGDSRGIAVFEHPERRADPRVAELSRIAALRMADQTTGDLVSWLGFPDGRLRLRAQFELARRRATPLLVALAVDGEADERARRHAVWGLGQIGSEGLAALAAAGPGILAAPAELRAQVARAAGEAGAVDWTPRLREWLADPAPRVRFFAAQALGRIADRGSVEPLVALVRENADEDVFLRHAAVLALHRIGDLDGLLVHREDPDPAVRRSVLLVLRRALDPRIAAFLSDPDPLLVVEAARAIYDGEIDLAMPALAALSGGLAPASADDRQVGQALHRRVIGANVRLRSETGAAALARYAADESQLESLRELALEQLASYAEPPVRDLTMGFHRPLPAIDRARVARVLARDGRALVDSSLGARALEVAAAYGVSPLSDEELLARLEAPRTAPRERIAALHALRERAALAREPAALRLAAEDAIGHERPGVRAAARDLLAALDPEAGLHAYLLAVEGGVDPGERRHAWRRLGESDSPRARDVLVQGMVYWETGQLADDVAVDVLEGVAARADEVLASRARAWLAGSPDAPVESRRWALAGGDPEAGRQVFQTAGDCQRCHGDPEASRPAADASGGAGRPAAGHDGGARIAPELAGIASRGALHVLESVVVPDARIADGFESPSSMPPMGLTLPPRALRDLVAYVASLD